MKNMLFLFAFVGALNSRPVKAQTAVTDTATKNFIIQASVAGIQEINAGKLASEKATDPQVKSFGNRMVTDHTRAENQLVDLAKRKGYQIPANATGPTAPDPMLKNAVAKDFDRIYVHMMVPDHRSAVSLFQKYAVSGKDPDIKAFAQQTLPTLKAHLEAIEAIDRQLKNTK